ncbi:MAG: ribonuclease [Clostridia bacterium]|nr:ribonuclease [Clostridia bacterium]
MMRYPLRRAAIGFCAALLLMGAHALAHSGRMEIAAADHPIREDGVYSSLEEVSVYLHTYGHLPSNYLTKRQAQDLGWDSRKGNLAEVAPDHAIGGDRFGNYEQNPDLPAGAEWTECDVNGNGGYRNGERIVFSRDGHIYYTSDHYSHFIQILVMPQ